MTIPSHEPVVARDELGLAFAPEAPGDWIVLHTLSRQEKALAEDLDRRGVRYFLPLIPSVRFYGKRKFTVHEPLFPGYLFLRGTMVQAYEADRTHRVANILRVTQQEEMDNELRNLALALSRNGQLNPFPFLRAGLPVEVKSGPFRGLRGQVETAGRWDRIILSVKLLGRSTSLDIHGSLVEPI